MRNVILIISTDKEGQYGYKGPWILPWKSSDDLKSFKQLTDKHNLVMGYNTLKSIKQPLLGRKIYVPTNTVRKTQEALNKLPHKAKAIKHKTLLTRMEERPNEMFFLAGGSSVYNEYFRYASEVYISIHQSKKVSKKRVAPILRFPIELLKNPTRGIDIAPWLLKETKVLDEQFIRYHYVR